MAKRPAKQPHKQLLTSTRNSDHHSRPSYQFRVGDRITDESGEWELFSRPYPIAGGKTVNVRVQRV